MSDKHYFPETAANQLVPRALRALVRATPQLSLIDSERVVYNNQHDASRVAVISGGGSGHEPAWSGYVGDGMLSGAACGDIFASPSTKQVLAAMAATPSNEGTILMITNYTGDRLHFGLAAERAKASGLSPKVVVLPATDDVSIPRSRIRVGRRGLAGHVLTLKAVGAAAQAKQSFERCVDIGKAVNDSLVTIGSALDHCHVPGRQAHETIDKDVCVVGAGIHNEPGAEHISPFPSVESLITHCLNRLCDPNDKERAFVSFENKNDQVILLINNYGGLSNLELGALADEVIIQLESTWKISPVKIYCGTFETSLNGPGFSISLSNVTQAARQANIEVPKLVELINAPTAAPAWPNSSSSPIDVSKLDSVLLTAILRRGCEAAIAAEPKLTEWDMIMGDGDCGEAVKGVSEAIIKLLDGSPSIAANGSIFTALFAILQAIDDMGGTLGAILGILLSAFASELQKAPSRDGLSATLYSTTLAAAAESLKHYTAAREGDRTVMDVLLPFAEAFASSNDFSSAVKVAGDKAEGTRFLKPRFGRATYVGEDKEQELPDPGAWAMFEFVKGMESGLKV
ncbi:Dak1 domain-containing protein [Dactylonectria macrodidyma]|uniref:Dak1 domain-containing protein n=1 Tax=Dactylonectria macrodidyma TaxID=307937 RepID=A0A9P9FW72_9HYPO|nr:Dak1 domain-containing protein [Dactylonectria macrodidyma]